MSITCNWSVRWLDQRTATDDSTAGNIVLSATVVQHLKPLPEVVVWRVTL